MEVTFVTLPIPKEKTYMRKRPTNPIPPPAGHRRMNTRRFSGHLLLENFQPVEQSVFNDGAAADS